MAIANSRVPKMVAGDINAEVVGVRTGAAGLVRVVERYGLERFDEASSACTTTARRSSASYFEKLPGRPLRRPRRDGLERHLGRPGAVRGDGRDRRRRRPRSTSRTAPTQQAGPINCPLPSTVSASRIAISMLAGGGEAPNEGHFRPIEVVTRPGTMFHPLPPAPCFLYGWPATRRSRRSTRRSPRRCRRPSPPAAAATSAPLVWWGVREGTGEPWTDGAPHPVGQGASAHGDGASSLMHVSEAATRFTPIEVWEAKNPWLLERVELAQDSCGPGRHRGGLGVDISFQHARGRLADLGRRAHRERPLGARGRRRRAAPTRSRWSCPTAPARGYAKATRLKVPKGSTVHLHTGGGGGYGDPAGARPRGRPRDLRDGYITEEHARRHYPHAFAGTTVSAGRRLIEVEHLAPMALGCSVLGAGGGGDTYTSLLASRHAIERFGPVELVDLDELPDDALVMPCGDIGAPVVVDREAGRRRGGRLAARRPGARPGTAGGGADGGRDRRRQRHAADQLGGPHRACRWSTPTAWAAPSRRCRR